MKRGSVAPRHPAKISISAENNQLTGIPETIATERKDTLIHV
jgi:hypothetical protein